MSLLQIRLEAQGVEAFFLKLVPEYEPWSKLSQRGVYGIIQGRSQRDTMAVKKSFNLAHMLPWHAAAVSVARGRSSAELYTARSNVMSRERGFVNSILYCHES